jgi:hypothetical protein
MFSEGIDESVAVNIRDVGAPCIIGSEHVEILGALAEAPCTTAA